MSEIEISWSEISVADFTYLADAFRGQYENIYVDGDRKAVVIVNPSERMKIALGR